MKFIGVMLDIGFTRITHITSLFGKLYRVSFALRTLYHLLNLDALLTVNHGSLSSVMSYSVKLLGGSSNTFKVSLEQKRVIEQSACIKLL